MNVTPAKTRRRRGRPARDAQTGAAAVEFALTVSLLLWLLMGLIDYGYFFYVDHVITNAAREGARAGSLWKDVSKAKEDAETTAKAYVKAGGLSDTIAKVQANVETAGSPLRVVMTVEYTGGSLTKFLPAGFIPDKVKSVSTMRRQLP